MVNRNSQSQCFYFPEAPVRPTLPSLFYASFLNISRVSVSEWKHPFFLLVFRSIDITQISPALNLGTGDWVQKPEAPPDHLEAHVNNHPYHPLRAS